MILMFKSLDTGMILMFKPLDTGMILMFKPLVETRIVVEYMFYQQTENAARFMEKWGVREGIVTFNDFGRPVFKW